MEQDKFNNQGDPEDPAGKPAPEESAAEKQVPEIFSEEGPAPEESAPEKQVPEIFSESEPDPEKKIDPVELNKAKMLFKYFDTAFSTMKLYPPGNPSVEKTVGIFLGKVKEFLDEYNEFRIGINEFSFTYKGEIAFQDEEKKRSLPFFLFKDGMRELTLYKGLEDKELKYFLDTLKEAIDLPPEESDAVGLLWERDFINIRYFALDEFLDLSIGGSDKSLDFEVDVEKLSQGKIEPTLQDLDERKEESDMLAFGQQREEGEGEGDLEGTEEADSRVPTVKPEELPEIEKMIAQDKRVSPLSELVALLFEILYYEENIDRFADVLKIQEKCFHEVIREADFLQALAALQNIQDLKGTFSEKSPDKVDLLDKVIKNATDESSMARLKKMYLEEKVKDFDAFLEYLAFLGPGAVSVVSMVWENPKGPVLKQRALEILREIGKENIAALIYIAKGSNVALTLEVIGMLETIIDLKDLHFLKDFVQHPNKDIRLEIVRVLGIAGNEEANKILSQFLTDDDVEVRAFAAQNLKYVGDEETFEFVLDLAADKEFKNKTKVEKKALLSFLASAQKNEAYDLFRSILKKWKLFQAFRWNETRHAVISALKTVPTPEAKKILEEGTKVFGKSVREACSLALSGMTSVVQAPSGEKPSPDEKPPPDEKSPSGEESPSDEKPSPVEEPTSDEKVPSGEEPPPTEKSPPGEEPPPAKKPPSGEEPPSEGKSPPEENPPSDEEPSPEGKPPSGE